MARQTKSRSKEELEEVRPALSPQAREQQLAAYAYDLAERQLREGTASSQVITHFLKVGSEEQRRRIEKLEEENKLLRAKTENLESSKRSEEMFAEAISAFKKYSGETTEDSEEEFYD